MKNYEILEHTADIGVRVKGGDLKELFKNAAQAMFDIIAEKKDTRTQGQHQDTRNISIRQKADSLEELFINWLNELLSLSATKEMVFCEFKINSLDEYRLEAEVGGSNINDYKINTEIKAATYHELKLGKTKLGWQAEIIFDV